MSTFPDNGHDAETEQFAAATAVQDGAPTESLVSSAVGDRCVNCGATLVSDQRYCVICGERRGAPRFTLPAATATTTQTTTSSVSGRGGARGPRFGSPTTLVAGVGTLLLALLFGFLIGNAASKNTTPKAAAAPVVKVVNTGGGAPTSSAGTSTASSNTSNSSAKTSSGSHKSKGNSSKPKVSKKTASAETNAASKTLGGNGTPPANTKVGQKCSGSACNKPGFNKKTKKFDGSFFGQ
jgi:hypothetical protein